QNIVRTERAAGALETGDHNCQRRRLRSWRSIWNIWHDGFWRGPALHREIFSARSERENSVAGRQFERRISRADREARLDGTGNDADSFKARANSLGAQVSKYDPSPGMHVNGEMTMGETIADLGGLTLALDAYRVALKDNPRPSSTVAPVINAYCLVGPRPGAE